MSILRKKFAFTLAEVLITLAIIGVVAALTIPTLVSNSIKTDTTTKLRKLYSTLSQAIKLSEVENGNNASWDWGDESTLTVQESFDKYWAPYLKITQMCNTTAECGYPASNKFNKPDGTASPTTIIDPTTRPSCILSDGTFLMVLPVDGSGTVVKTIYTDLNAGKGPNRLGRDVFVFKLNDKRGVTPQGYNSSIATINSNCSTSGRGSSCLQKIVQDGWEIADDYPW